MAVVASLHFCHLPAGSASLCGKWREERPRRISFGDAGNVGGWNARFAIGRKRKRLLEATQSEITEPRAHEISRLAWLQPPEIELAFPARQPPAVSLLSRDFSEMRANLIRKQVQHTLPIFWNEGIQENQTLDSSRDGFDHTADDHACVTVTNKDYGSRKPG